MSNSNYSIGLQRLKPVHTAYGVICMPIRKLSKLVFGTRRKWPRPRRWQFFSRWDRDETLVHVLTYLLTYSWKGGSGHATHNRCFATAGPTLWNSLPEQLRQPGITFGQFKRSMKTFILVSWAAAPCVWTLTALTRNLLTYLLTCTTRE